MIMLHMVLVLRHLERGAASLRTLGQGLFDAFCRDLDGNVREIAVGDLAVQLAFPDPEQVVLQARQTWMNR